MPALVLIDGGLQCGKPLGRLPDLLSVRRNVVAELLELSSRALGLGPGLLQLGFALRISLGRGDVGVELRDAQAECVRLLRRGEWRLQ
ncbi:MAG: hypothetical protein BWZ09_02598 [Alphaproteobacteria bacterium ADurb.BinA305]|nr:MAG: hypothetical protein BWZ09_02598 [Alphaproteobacteria bacterium ADurb.BinA305]